jgi:hypothetical protein
MATKCKECYDCVPKRGERGLQGTIGPQGPAGPQGPQGVPGLTGANGTDGTDANIDVIGGNDIIVTPITVGDTTTYTISTETPLLKKFIYEVILPTGNINQQISILNPTYTPCGIPTIGCDGTLTALPTVVDLIIQGYWFNIDENAWIEFTHEDKTVIGVDILGNISIFPAFTPAPVDLDEPVRIRITIIG